MNSDSLNMVSRLGEGHIPCTFFSLNHSSKPLWFGRTLYSRALINPDHDRIFPTNSDVLIAAINRLKGTILTRHFRIDLLETLVVKYSALIERKSLGNNKRTKNEGRQNQTTDKKGFYQFHTGEIKKEDSTYIAKMHSFVWFFVKSFRILS